MQSMVDAIVPIESGRFVTEHVPNGRFVAFDGDEHWPWGAAGRAAADTLAEFLVGTPDVISPDRVLATVLFTDIRDSTGRAAEVAERNSRALLDFHDRTSRTEVERQRGRLVKSTGDGVLATFDGPARAVRAALTLTKEMAQAGVPIRAGLHTGEIELRGTMSAASPFTSLPGSPLWPASTRSSCPERSRTSRSGRGSASTNTANTR